MPILYIIVGAGLLGGLLVVYETVVPWAVRRLIRLQEAKLLRRRLDELRVCCRGCTAR